MQFRIKPKPMIGTYLYVNVINVEDTQFTVYYEIRRDVDKQAIERGNWTFSIDYLQMFILLKPDMDGNIQNDPDLRAQLNAIMSDPGIDMVVEDYPVEPSNPE